MWREKRQRAQDAQCLLNVPPRYGKLHVQANGDHARHTMDERMELKK